MADEKPFEVPEITDEDVRWATSVLGLPENAFFGEDGTDPRKEVLKEMVSIDVSACPGSGKTTLLVAKLAILANKWKYRTRGICVLSHTNAARDEIEKRLGHSAVGRNLLSYPHFIGTIHGFVDHFFALPWLRSKGYPIKIVDTEVCLSKRWFSLSRDIRNGLERNRYTPSVMSIRSPAFDLGEVRWGRGTLSKNSNTYTSMENACRLTTEQGYFCYDEMFMWASELISKRPEMINIICSRFPMLFIDETQDNSESQSQILNTIFQAGVNPVIRQRFGDENQAIYDFMGAKEASTDKFPIEGVKREIPNSHRFCEYIARLSGPLGLNSDTCNLTGEGPIGHSPISFEEGSPHTIFLFDDKTIHNVLNAYGNLIISSFSNDFIRKGVFTAVGQVHRSDDDTRKPRHVGHYWPDYDYVLCSKAPKPDSFLKYVYVGFGMAQQSKEVNPFVEKIAEGILHLAGMAWEFSASPKKGGYHRLVLRLLEDHPQMAGEYGRVVHDWVINGALPTKDVWEGAQNDQIRKFAEVIAQEPLNSQAVNHFMRWEGVENEPVPKAGATKCRDNIYRYSEGNETVHIRVGSIHSVKGETHAATLVLETFWHDHNLESIMNWLCDAKRGCSGVGVRIRNRLKIHYVAMTRPSHLLCLAIKRASLEDADGKPKLELCERLRNLGWRIVLV
jgi:DNA helicase II / ATP-dependent DNA helicase PcrA